MTTTSGSLQQGLPEETTTGTTTPATRPAGTPLPGGSVPRPSSPSGRTLPPTSTLWPSSPALPPLVFAGEARRLTRALGEVATGKAFLLQAGDCAESFDDFSADGIRDKLKVILQMAVVLTYGSGVPVIKVGRIAGQFAKPRSSPTELVDDVELPVFRGHIINDDVPTASARVPDPAPDAARLPPVGLDAEPAAGLHQGRLRRPVAGALVEPRVPDDEREGRRFEAIAEEIDRALRFMNACGVDLSTDSPIHQVDLFTSHEALLLGYEEALTRKDSLTGDWYDCSAHLVWIGERTRQIDGAHVEFATGIGNPIEVKLGPDSDARRGDRSLRAAQPRTAAPGRLTFVTRMGVDKVRERPAARSCGPWPATGHPIAWVCDPMHGNTFASESGRKTRHFDDVLGEIQGFFAVHRSVGTWPGGVHIELTGDDVTECLGGIGDILEEQLPLRYTTACDPRLNARQSIDLAFRVAELLRD